MPATVSFFPSSTLLGCKNSLPIRWHYPRPFIRINFYHENHSSFFLCSRYPLSFHVLALLYLDWRVRREDLFAHPSCFFKRTLSQNTDQLFASLAGKTELHQDILKQGCILYLFIFERHPDVAPVMAPALKISFPIEVVNLFMKA